MHGTTTCTERFAVSGFALGIACLTQTVGVSLFTFAHLRLHTTAVTATSLAAFGQAECAKRILFIAITAVDFYLSCALQGIEFI